MADRRGDLGALWLALVFSVGWGTVLFGLGLMAFGMLLATEQPMGGPLPTWLVVATTGVQLPAMVALVPVAQLLVGWLWYGPRQRAARPQGWTGVFGAWPAPHAFWALGIALGLLVGWLPGLLAESLRELVGSEGSLDFIAKALTEGPAVWRVLFALEICVGAPLAEELVFRGFFWDTTRRSAGPLGALIVTSVLFAAYHLDPVQSPATLVTGLALGWLRWTSGSVWPGVLLHAANNALGVGLVVLAVEAESDVALAVVGGLGAACLLGLLGLLRRRHPDGLASDAAWPPDATA
ncbi:MAG: CPBP family intramembrane metalloprotease [Alphaproteobacteria bacterium]|nr:CPBP family intramembrane metalloprotease [Alphaproteobacteria bacterium]